MITKSAEDPNTTYVTLPEDADIRHIFREGKYIGWYKP